jgi:CheY-like chemotaxis protein
MIAGRPAKILLIDSNVYFSKRLGDALKKEGFEVLSSTQPAFALTTLEYDAPAAVVCATNMREMGALEIAKIIHADPKNATLPIIALGDGSQRALMEAFQAGCEDYIDRQRPPAVIATHIRQIVISKAEGFQPTQMLAQADTSLSGSLTHHDLPGVLQMLGHAHQTGALHINAGATDALLFFDAGNITHAECGNLFGDEAVIHIIKSCVHGDKGVYKFVYGATSTKHTVLRNATDLMLDAMREYDESSRDSADDGGDLDTEALATSQSSPGQASESSPSEESQSNSADLDDVSRLASNLDFSHVVGDSPLDPQSAASPSQPDLLEQNDPAPTVTEDHSRATTSDDGITGFSEENPTPSADDHTFETHTVDRDPLEGNTFEQDAFEHKFDTTQHDAVSTAPEIEHFDHERPTQPEAQGFPPVPQSPTLPIYPPSDTDATLLSPGDISASSIQNEEAPVVTTATIKRSDLLQAELSTHPTTITERILSDLHAHGDNPVDRALAELLSKQLNGEYQHGPSHFDDPSHEHSDSSNADDIQHEHVRLSEDSDNPDKELP